MEQDTYTRRFEFLYKAMEDGQSTIRMTDAKAVAALGFWTFFITTVFRTKDTWMPYASDINSWAEVVFISLLFFLMILFLVQSIFLAYLGLVPRNNPNEHIETNGLNLKQLFYLHGYNKSYPLKPKYLFKNHRDLKLDRSTENYISEMNHMDEKSIQEELVVELQKISFIRNLKIDRISTSITFLMRFLLVLGILITYFFGKEIFKYEGGSTLVAFDINVTLFIVLYIGHKIADYLFQTDYQAINKSSKWTPLFAHCIAYTIIVLGFAYLFTGFFNYLAIFILFLSHILIDHKSFLLWWAKYVKRMKNPNDSKAKLALFELDQAFHYVVLFFISLI